MMNLTFRICRQRLRPAESQMIVVRSDDYVFCGKLRIASRKNAYNVRALAVDLDYVRFEIDGLIFDNKCRPRLLCLPLCICKRTLAPQQRIGGGAADDDGRHSRI